MTLARLRDLRVRLLCGLPLCELNTFLTEELVPLLESVEDACLVGIAATCGDVDPLNLSAMVASLCDDIKRAQSDLADQEQETQDRQQEVYRLEEKLSDLKEEIAHACAK